MAEILVKASDYTHPDPDKDRRGVHKQGDIINIKPNGWSDNPNWISSSYPYSKTGSFVLIKIPELTEEEVIGLREPWADDFDYEIIDEVPADGKVDLRIFEKNVGAVSNANSISGSKADIIKEALGKWNIVNIVQNEFDVVFSFILWDAVNSTKFWGATPERLATMTLSLNAYDSVSKIAVVTANVPDEKLTEEQAFEVSEKLQGATIEKLAEYSTQETAKAVQEVNSKLTMQGAVISTVDAETKDFTFTIDQAVILDKFKQDVKMLQQTYTRHRHCIDSATMALAIINGGILTMTKEDFTNSLQDKMI